MAINQEASAAILYDCAKDSVESYAKQVRKSRQQVDASAVLSEEELDAVINSEEDVEYIFTLNGTAMTLEEVEHNEPHMAKVLDEGKPTPVTKGPDGTRIEIDGSIGESHSYSEGYPLTQYAFPATHYKKEAHEMLKTTLPDIVSGFVPEAQPRIVEEEARPAILEYIQQGGGS